MGSVAQTVAHTPGPWLVIDSYRGANDQYKRSHPRDIMIHAVDPSKASIAEVASIPTSSPQAIHDRELANANLLAAAPDLLNALERAKETIRAFNGIGLSGSNEQHAWELFQDSPEMRVINAALGKAKGGL